MSHPIHINNLKANKKASIASIEDKYVAKKPGDPWWELGEFLLICFNEDVGLGCNFSSLEELIDKEVKEFFRIQPLREQIEQIYIELKQLLMEVSSDSDLEKIIGRLGCRLDLTPYRHRLELILEQIDKFLGPGIRKRKS